MGLEVIFANPESFKKLEFPYSKDKNHVFCGTIPLSLPISEVKEFEVTKDTIYLETFRKVFHLSTDPPATVQKLCDP